MTSRCLANLSTYVERVIDGSEILHQLREKNASQFLMLRDIYINCFFSHLSPSLGAKYYILPGNQRCIFQVVQFTCRNISTISICFVGCFFLGGLKSLKGYTP